MPDLSHVTLTGRPLIISDVDDVILQFIAPFETFLGSRNLKFIPRSFRLAGNIIDRADETPVAPEAIKTLLHDFFAAQHEFQQPFETVLPTLSELAREADIVFLTAMPPQFAEQRRRHLAALGLPYPLIATESAKGPVAARLTGDAGKPVVFVDDMAHNLASVGEHVPHCLLLSLPPQSEVHRLAPPPPEPARAVADWTEAAVHIRGHFIAP